MLLSAVHSTPRCSPAIRKVSTNEKLSGQHSVRIDSLNRKAQSRARARSGELYGLRGPQPNSDRESTRKTIFAASALVSVPPRSTKWRGWGAGSLCFFRSLCAVCVWSRSLCYLYICLIAIFSYRFRLHLMQHPAFVCALPGIRMNCDFPVVGIGERKK